MSRCRKEQDPDLICTKYSVASNRSTRLLLLEMAAEYIRGVHTYDCRCFACVKIAEAFALKPTPQIPKSTH